VSTNYIYETAQVEILLQSNISGLGYVAGPRASNDAKIYDAVKKVLTSVLHLDQVLTAMPDPAHLHPHLPGTVEEAVEYLVSRLHTS
jgi:hypothetical protein